MITRLLRAFCFSTLAVVAALYAQSRDGITHFPDEANDFRPAAVEYTDAGELVLIGHRQYRGGLQSSEAIRGWFQFPVESALYTTVALASQGRPADAVVRDDGLTFVTGTVPQRGDVFAAETARQVTDIFVAAYEADGRLRWFREFGTAGNDAGVRIAVDAEGALLLAGTFEGSIEFNEWTLSGFGQKDVFVIRMSEFGRVLWARGIGGEGNDHVTSLANSANNNWLVAGSFQNTAFVTGDALESSGGSDIFLAEFDKDGEGLWSVSAGGEGDDEARDIAYSASGRIYVTGAYNESAEFGAITVSARADDQAFLAAYQTGGQLSWIQAGIGSYASKGERVAVEGTGDVLVAGEFEDELLFDTGSVTARGARDLFLARFSERGDLIATDRAGNAAHERVVDLVLLPNAGQLVVGGTSDSQGENEGLDEIFIEEQFYFAQTRLGGEGKEFQGNALTINSFHLSQNFPNPFNPTTRIDFQTAIDGPVTLTIYNVVGERVNVLVDNSLPAGAHHVDWQAVDAQGLPVPAGVYFYELRQGDKLRATRKMILAR